MRIVLKAIALLCIINFIFITVKDIPIGNPSLYNTVYPGRSRLPFGEQPEISYNLTMNNLDAMLASHEINQNNDNDAFRIAILGDSSIWGFLQENQDTLSGMLNENLRSDCAGKDMRFYNLGYPSLSVIKDLMILDGIEKIKPDLIIWFITLESLPLKEQMKTPLVMNNPLIVNRLIEKYKLDYAALEINLMDYTLIGRRREFADIIRLQLYGIPWSATERDQPIHDEYTPALRDFESDIKYKTFKTGEMKEADLALDVLLKANEKIKDDLIFINEPILISSGINSEIRYNFYYPRWAYDAYREITHNFMIENGLDYYDFWDIIDESEFTNSAIHLTNIGEKILAYHVSGVIDKYCENNLD